MSLNQNPLIEEHSEETLINIQTILIFIQDMHTKLAISDGETIPSVNHGLSLILKCAEGAITYEINKLEMIRAKEAAPFIFKA